MNDSVGTHQHEQQTKIHFKYKTSSINIHEEPQYT